MNNYSFETLKTLYDKYTIEKTGKSGRTVIVDRKTREQWEYEGVFAACVNFAHTWVFATRYNPNKSENASKSKISDDDYGRAFSDASKDNYNAIMECLVTYLQEYGKMPKCNVLIENVSKKLGSLDANKVINGLYAKKSWYASLVFWSLQIAGMEDLLEDLLEKMQEKNSNHVAAREKMVEEGRNLAA